MRQIKIYTVEYESENAVLYDTVRYGTVPDSEDHEVYIMGGYTRVSS